MQTEAPGIGSRHHASFAIVRHEANLSRILRPRLNVCTWRRSLPLKLLEWLARFSRDLVHDVSVRVSFDHGAVVTLFSGLPECDESRAWTDDVKLLTLAFSRIAGPVSLQASLAAVHTDRCRKFHADHKPLRLVCTYAGPGTEWVDDRDADRAALGQGESSFETANARIVPRRASIRRAKAGDVVVLKGDLFPGCAGRGAIHRSPPIQSSGQRRIVFTLDAMDSLKDVGGAS